MIADDVKIGEDGKVTGNILYLSDVPLYEGEEKKGHYFPIRFFEKNFKPLHVGGAAAEDGFTAGKDIQPTPSDPFLVIRVENCTDGEKVTIFDRESKDELFTLDFSEATKQENPVTIQRRARK